MIRNKNILIILSLIITIMLCLIYFIANQPYRELASLVKTLQTENDVESVFGLPEYIFYKGTNDYYLDGWTYKQKVISSKAVVYFPKENSSDYMDMILYIYYDAQHNVEDYFVGGS